MKQNLLPLPIDVVSIKRAAFLARALNHPSRQRMLGLMDEYEALSVTQLQELLHEQQAIVSSHLTVLREARLVEVLREGKTRWYSVNYERMHRIQTAVDRLWNQKKGYAAGREMES